MDRDENSGLPSSFEVIEAPVGDWEASGSLLRRKSVPARAAGVDINRVVADLLQSLEAIPYGTGLSAVQIGIPVQIAVVTLNRVAGDELVLIDPISAECAGRPTVRQEGCLSLPHYKGPVTRRNRVTVRAHDVAGAPYEYAASGYEAAIIQHELDHFAGVLYWDHMEDSCRPKAV
jgi:peptide deformylase